MLFFHKTMRCARRSTLYVLARPTNVRVAEGRYSAARTTRFYLLTSRLI